MTLRAGKLAVIATFLALAATLKLVEGASSARAQMPEPRVTTGELAQQPGDRIASDDGGGAAAVAGPGALNADVLIELRHREARLTEREAELDGRATELADLELRIRAQIATLEEAERALSATMALADTAAETDLARLTSVFEAMRPEQAAAVIAEMAPEFAAGLIGRLQPETAATILAGLEPRFAYGLAAILAGRNARVPQRSAD